MNKFLLFLVLIPAIGMSQFSARNVINDYITPNQIRQAVSGDIDGDGYNDVVIAAGQKDEIQWYKNDQEGGFGLPITITTLSNNAYSVSLADIDLDGDLDVFGCSFTDSEVAWYENMGDGTFGPQQIISSSDLGPTWVLASDIDSDGDQDLYVTSITDSTLSWYENMGDGDSWVQHIIKDEAFQSRFVTLADLNNDNIEDLLYLSDYNRVSWFASNGDGTFGEENVIATTGGAPEWIEPIDVDGDGHIDIMTASSIYEGIWMYKNNGDGTFTDELVIGPEIVYHPRSVVSVDYDLDGDMDILAGGDNDIVLFANDGTGYFGEKIVIENDDVDKAILFVVDIDNDGDLDFVESGQWTGHLGWYTNFKFHSNKVSGTLYFDINSNSVLDIDDVPFGDYMSVLSSPMSDFTFTMPDGSYEMILSDVEGTYLIFPESLEEWELTSDSTFYTIHLNEEFLGRTNLDFGFTATQYVNDISTDLTATSSRCSTPSMFWISIENEGTTIPSGKITLVLDESVIYSSSEIEPESIVDNVITWDYEDLYFYETRNFWVLVVMPSVVELDVVVTSVVTATIDSSGVEIFSAEKTLDQTITCSFDPNDKAVSPAGIDEQGYVPMSTTNLEYIIRFQNTGTDTAYIVEIEDQLSPLLDWTSLQPMSSSHDMTVHVDENGIITFLFDDIMLPDSIVDEPRSHGYLKYNIDLLPGLPEGSVIENTAAIYFDFNAPVITNTTTNTLALWASIEENKLVENANITFYPNPFSGLLNVSIPTNNANKMKVYNLLGELVFEQVCIADNGITIDLSHLHGGTYLLSVVDLNGDIVQTKRIVKM